MYEWHCDLCNETAPYTDRRRMTNSAIRDMTGAENVCKSCFETAQAIDWNAVVRREIKEAKP